MPIWWSKTVTASREFRASLFNSEGMRGEYALIVLSILIGAITALGAHLFFMLLEWTYQLTFGGEGPGPKSGLGLYGGHGVMLVLLPASGALLVGFLTRYFAREAKGHGVPEVMDALHRSGGVIRPRVSLAKALGSVLTLGTGGSAGTEGPIVQIGAAIGSTLGQWLHVDRRHMSTLVACGVAAGIAAIFNTPIAGVLFALEIFLRDFSFKTFSPIVFASVISTSLTHHFRMGDRAIFALPTTDGYFFAGAELPYYLVLGLFCALTAVAFIRCLYAFEDIADASKLPEPLKPVIGAALLGVLGVMSVWLSGHVEVPAFYGNGYNLIRIAIGPNLLGLGIGTLVFLCVVKIIVTSLTLGSGGSGGILAPSLFMGACLGGAFGISLYQLGLVESGSVSAYAIVGMAAVVAATTHAPLTAIVILYELTRQPKVILPVMFAAIVATGVAQLLLAESIYTLKLARRGIRFGRLADITILKRIQAAEVRTQPTPFLHPVDPFQKLLDIAGDTDSPDFIVVDSHGDYLGMVVGTDVKTALLQPEAIPLLLIGELVRSGIPTISPDDTLADVMNTFARAHVNSLPITALDDNRHVEGLITREAIMDRYQTELEKSS